jgi:1-acyl-sn-glycerol-3-phosphate acyltransferase
MITKRTLFNTPIVTPLLRGLAMLILKLTGWRVEGETPQLKKYVLIAAPHTSNYDFPVMLAASLSRRIVVSWMGKAVLFKGLKGPLARYLGGVAIDRSQSNDVVTQVADQYRERDQLIVIICPEGTRKKVERWKTGFYHIACSADVPVVMAYADYPSKRVGFGPPFIPTGDLETDLREIQAFYTHFTGKQPDRC